METSIFTAVFKLMGSQAFVFVVLALSIIAAWLEYWPKFDSRYIPIILIPLGPMVYPLFVSPGTVDPGFPYPMAVLVVEGLVAGLIAVIAHKWIVAALMKKFSQPDSNPPPSNP